MNAPSPILYFDPQLVVELALGAEHPHDVAERYGVSAVEYEHLDSLPWFHAMVAQKRLDLHDNGLLFQTKAAMMAEALLTNLFQQSMSAKLAAPIMIEVSKQLVDIGRLKPQPGVAGPASGQPAFAINIQINGTETTIGLPSPAPSSLLTVPSASTTEPSPPAPVIEGMAAPTSRPPDAPVAAMTLDFTPQLPPPPSYISNLKVPNLDRMALIPSALTGTPIAQAAAVTLPPAPSQPSSQPPTGTQVGIGLPSRSPLG